MDEKRLKEGLEMFGLESFRPGQVKAVESIVSGRDTLVVMPTGSGKSLCFQLPAMLGEGLTLCISPLIALMKDQVDALEALGLPATCLTSHLTTEERRERLERVAAGEVRLLYVAPERLEQRRFRQVLDAVEVERLVVDEAHCVSQWGHDFRPDYMRIAALRERLGDPPLAALTATATTSVQRDIVEQLAMREPEVLVHGFERPNLSFQVFHTFTDTEKTQQMVRIARHADGSVVVYCATRKETDAVATALREAGIASDKYHGGMTDAQRSRIQDDWMAGKVAVLAATNAFGMGVDKADVRAIIHHNIPGSVEAYYQEAGRAGRDGDAAQCAVLYEYGDRGIHDFFIRNSYPDAKWYERVWEELSEYEHGETVEVKIDVLCRRAARDHQYLHAMAGDTILRKLKSHGHVRNLHQRGAMRTFQVIDPGSELRIDFAALGKRRQVAERQLGDIVGWVENAFGCRQAALVRYFNSEPAFGERCGVCDYCVRTAADADVGLLVRKVLSGVARGQGRAGRSAIVAMLCGRSDTAVRALRLHETPTFGLLATLREDTVSDVFSACERGGLIGGRRRRTRQLTDVGAHVMRGEADVSEKVEKAVRRVLRRARR